MTNAPVVSTAGLRQLVQEKGEEPLHAGHSIQSEVREMKDQFALALTGSRISPDRFVRVALTQFRRTPKLMQCTRESILGSLLTVAQLGLDFTLQHAYLIPYEDHRRTLIQCQLIIGYRGYLDLARRSGEIKDIKVQEVYEGDEFDFWADENGDRLLYRPRLDGKRGDIKLYFLRVLFTNGGHHINVMLLEDVERRKLRSAAVASGRTSPWTTDPIAMSKKTLVRATTAYLPLTTEVAEQLQRDEAVIRYTAPGLDMQVEFPEAPESQALAPPSAPVQENTPKRSSRTKSALKSEPRPPGPEPHPEDARPPEADQLGEPAGNLGAVPQDLLDSTQAAIQGWTDTDLTRVLHDWALAATGSPRVRQLRALTFFAQKRWEQTQAAEALF
jgi:recombination protein RecT